MFMKIIPLIFILILLNIANAGIVFDSQLQDRDSFEINNLEYEYGYSAKSEKALITSKLSKLIINNNDCEIQGYYKFCLKNKQLTISKEDCLEYNDEDGNKICKKEINEICIENTECLSKQCHNGICTLTTPICGDGYCDNNEDCDEDCDLPYIMDSNIFTVPVNKDWIDTDFKFQKDTKYYFEIEGDYSLDYTKKMYNFSGKLKPSTTSPCPGINEGALVANLCNTCYPLSLPIQLQENCPLKLRINEKTLIDNEGKVILKISDQPPEPKIKLIPDQPIIEKKTLTTSPYKKYINWSIYASIVLILVFIIEKIRLLINKQYFIFFRNSVFFA